VFEIEVKAVAVSSDPVSVVAVPSKLIPPSMEGNAAARVVPRARARIRPQPREVMCDNFMVNFLVGSIKREYGLPAQEHWLCQPQ
jgi:hypothetical protein